jgi:hypothetical protein
MSGGHLGDGAEDDGGGGELHSDRAVMKLCVVGIKE